MDTANKVENAAEKSANENVVTNGVGSDASEEELPESVRNLKEDELVEQQKRLKKEGETTLIVDGAWRSVPQSQFRTAFPGCVRVINRRYKYTIMKFETHEQAVAALTVLRNDGFLERKPDVELQSERRDYKDLEGRKFDLLRLQLLGLSGKVPFGKLKETFPDASNIIYHNALVKSGTAIIIFSNEESARKAFFDTANLQLRERDVAVVYCQYRPNRVIRTRSASGRYQRRKDTGDVDHIAHVKELPIVSVPPADPDRTAILESEELLEVEERIKNMRLRTILVKGSMVGNSLADVKSLVPDLKRLVRKGRDAAYLEFDSSEVCERVHKEIDGVTLKDCKLSAIHLDGDRINLATKKFNLYRLYVEGLPFRIRRAEIRKLFPSCRDIVQSRNMLNNGVAIVRFTSTEECRKVFAESKSLVVEERPLTVTFMKAREEQARRGRGRYSKRRPKLTSENNDVNDDEGETDLAINEADQNNKHDE